MTRKQPPEDTSYAASFHSLYIFIRQACPAFFSRKPDYYNKTSRKVGNFFAGLLLPIILAILLWVMLRLIGLMGLAVLYRLSATFFPVIFCIAVLVAIILGFVRKRYWFSIGILCCPILLFPLLIIAFIINPPRFPW